VRENCLFHEIGALYRGADNNDFFIGPIVTQSVFLGPRRQLFSRNRGPYYHDSDFVRALVDIQVSDIHLVQTMSPDHPNLDSYLFKDAHSVLHAVEELRSLIPQIFPKDDRNDPIRTVLRIRVRSGNTPIPDVLLVLKLQKKQNGSNSTTRMNYGTKTGTNGRRRNFGKCSISCWTSAPCRRSVGSAQATTLGGPGHR